MVQARFINDTKTVDVHGETQETKISVTSETQLKSIGVKPSINHNDLSGRGLLNQHPISAITGLQEALEDVSDKNFVFEQGIASDTWVIEHNLNKHPSVTVVDSSGYVRIPNDIKYDNENQITVYLISEFTGKAFLN